MASSDLFVTRKNRGGTWMTNDVVWGVRLSAPTLGLFVYMLSMPPHAPKTRDSMSGHFGLGRRAVSTALKELEQAGVAVSVPCCWRAWQIRNRHRAF